MNRNNPRYTRSTDGFYNPSPRQSRRLSPFALHRQDAPAAKPAARRVGAVQTAKATAPSPLRSAVRPASSTVTSRAGDGAVPKAVFSYAPRYNAGARGGADTKKNRRFGFARMGWKKSLLTAGAMVFIVAASIGGWVGWKLYRNVAKITHNNNPFSLLQVFHPVALKSQSGRVNVLIAGDSVGRTDNGGGTTLTDSIMILSIDTHTNTAFMLSIPRDTWVQMPSQGGSVAGSHQKINAANTLTGFDQPGYPRGGMGALEYVIQTNLGIPIDYYALVNYDAFQSLVDALGGITVNIQSPDPRGLYDPQPFPGAKSFKLANGVQTLSGIQALDLARARGDAYGSYGFPQSDFNRTEHQRWMVFAIKDKASSPSVIANPFKVSGLLDAVGNNVATDLKLDEIETLYSLTKKINDANITSDNINTLNGKNTTLLANYSAPNGESALIPAAGVDNFSGIRKAIQKLLSDNPIAKETATVVVLNAGNIVGLAKAEGTVLTNKGMNVAVMADAPTTQTANSIIDNSAGADPATKAALEGLFGTNVVASASLTRAYPGASFIVVLGTSQQMPAGASSTSTTSSTTQTPAGD